MPLMGANSAIHLETSLPDYFRRHLHRHAARLRPSPTSTPCGTWAR